MTLKISDRFNYSGLLRFTLPSVVMMLFTSIYVIADGYFVSNYVGKTALAAVNFAYPVLMILGSIGFMFGTGGSALISKKMGEGKKEEASSLFSSIVVFSSLLGVVLTVLGYIHMKKIAYFMGARGTLLEYSTLYGRIIISCLPSYILQYEFQCLLITANKSKLGLGVTILAGLTNIIADAVLIIVFRTGVAGAAAATALSQLVGGIVPLIYFMRKNDSLLHFTFKFKWKWNDILKTVTNGSSEFMGNISQSIVSAIYNLQLLKYSGEDGLAAYSIIMYVAIVFMSLFIGYSVGSAPVISYNYGAGDKEHLSSLVRKSYVIITVQSVFMFAVSFVLARPLGLIFVSYDRALLDFTVRAFKIFSLSFLFSGFSIFSSSLFTALNNGAISALISFMRTLFFQVVSVLVIPLVFGLDGIWMSTGAAEFFSLILSLALLFSKRRKYGY